MGRGNLVRGHDKPNSCELLAIYLPGGTWMSQEVSKRVITYLKMVIYKLLINGVYWGYNPLILTFLLTSWDIDGYLFCFFSERWSKRVANGFDKAALFPVILDSRPAYQINLT